VPSSALILCSSPLLLSSALILCSSPLLLSSALILCSSPLPSQDAQLNGIAETDPSGDIDGWDAAVKVIVYE
jgi:hypothetical protein